MERIPYARAADGSTVHISEVRFAGLACRCTCPACGAALEAVNVENPAPQRTPHFRHYELQPTSDCAAYSADAGLARVIGALRRLTVPTGVTPPKPESKPSAAQGSLHLDFDLDDSNTISGTERIDSATVRLHLSDGRVVEIHLQQRAPRKAIDWARISAVLDLPLSAQDLAAMTPAQALELLQSGHGQWRHPPPIKRDPPVSPVMPGRPPAPRLTPAPAPNVPAPATAWEYRWAMPASDLSWIRAAEILKLRQLAPEQIDTAVEQLQKRHRPGTPARPDLEVVAQYTGLPYEAIRDLAQHARAISAARI